MDLIEHCNEFLSYSYPSEHVDRGDNEDSIGNLKRHADACDPEATLGSESIAAFANDATYSLARLRSLLVIWCVSRHRPFKIVEDPEFCGMLGVLYGKVQISSRVIVSRDVQVVLDETMVHLIDRFEVREDGNALRSHTAF